MAVPLRDVLINMRLKLTYKKKKTQHVKTNITWTVLDFEIFYVFNRA